MVRGPLVASCLMLALAGCAGLAVELGLVPPEPPATAQDPDVVGDEDAQELLVPVAAAPPPPRPTARTVEEFDTTSAEDRAAALAAPRPGGGETRLGTTVASLGSPADPGIWLSTPLVTSVTQGRVEYPATGASVSLELRPSGGVVGSGSEISLPAMRLLEIPLTALPELVVYR